MTTDQDLRDALRTGAGGAAGSPPPWDEMRRRGHRRRQAYRARSLTLAAVMAGGLLGVFAYVRAEPNATVTVTDPDPSPTVPEAPTTLPYDPLLPTLQAVRGGSGPFLTFVLSVPETIDSIDPCTSTSIEMTGDASSVTVLLRRHEGTAPSAWVECGSSPFGIWATVELEEPLGVRRLTDGSTGRDLDVAENASLLYPRRLPAPFDIDRHTEAGQSVYEGYPVGGWTFSWIAGDVVLNVSRWGLVGDHPEGCGDGEGSDVAVRGVTGRLCRSGPPHALLSWIVGEQIHIIELSDVSGEPLPQDIDLIDIANQLEPLR